MSQLILFVDDAREPVKIKENTQFDVLVKKCKKKKCV